MKRAKCGRFHVSPELAAVIVAADRVVDRIAWSEWRRAVLFVEADGSKDLWQLDRAVKVARAAAEKRDGYKPKKKDVAL